MSSPTDWKKVCCRPKLQNNILSFERDAGTMNHYFQIFSNFPFQNLVAPKSLVNFFCENNISVGFESTEKMSGVKVKKPKQSWWLWSIFVSKIRRIISLCEYSFVLQKIEKCKEIFKIKENEIVFKKNTFLWSSISQVFSASNSYAKLSKRFNHFLTL